MEILGLITFLLAIILIAGKFIIAREVNLSQIIQIIGLVILVMILSYILGKWI